MVLLALDKHNLFDKGLSDCIAVAGAESRKWIRILADYAFAPYFLRKPVVLLFFFNYAVN